MKYIAIIDTDDYKDFEFFEDGNGKYMVVKDAGATANGGWMPLYFTECEQELKTEHWIFKQFDEETDISNNYWCSNCADCGVYKTYCANCKSKMVEP